MHELGNATLSKHSHQMWKRFWRLLSWLCLTFCSLINIIICPIKMEIIIYIIFNLYNIMYIYINIIYIYIIIYIYNIIYYNNNDNNNSNNSNNNNNDNNNNIYIYIWLTFWWLPQFWKNTRHWENLRAGGSQVWPKSTLSMDIFEMGLT